MKKLIATIGAVTALGIGAFALNSVMPAGALGTAVTQTGTASSDPSASSAGSTCDGGRARFKGVLDGLVQNNTINQSQEDAIVQAFRDAAKDHPRLKARLGGLRVRVATGMVQVAADKIGVSVDDLKAALKDGKSIADVANDHSVAPSDVVSAIVDAGNAKIDAAVTAGKLTNEQGAKVKARLPQLADKFVNRTKPEGC